MKDDILVFRLFSDHLRNQFNKNMKKRISKKKLVLSQQNKIRCIRKIWKIWTERKQIIYNESDVYKSNFIVIK